MSYSDSLYMDNIDAGHHSNCSYAGGGDCSCGKSPPYEEEEEESTEVEEGEYIRQSDDELPF